MRLPGTDVDVDFVEVVSGDQRINVAVAGDGPLIVFVHGWPELWYSWRHQLAHFAARGHRAAALDVRGYGGSSKPTEIEAYRLSELCADVAEVAAALQDAPAIVVGHDWGAPIAWNTARLHPDRVRAVAGLSVPYRPVGPRSPIELWRELYAGRFFYQLYFQEPGVAEAELAGDPARSLRMIYRSIGGDGTGGFGPPDKPADARLLDGIPDPGDPPPWMTDDDLAVYVDAFRSGGWTGPLNRYRAQAFDADELGTRPDPELAQPAAFIAGERDPVRRFVPGIDVYAMAGDFCADFRGTTIVPGAGHWVQQEAPAAINAALDRFLDGL